MELVPFALPLAGLIGLFACLAFDNAVGLSDNALDFAYVGAFLVAFGFFWSGFGWLFERHIAVGLLLFFGRGVCVALALAYAGAIGCSNDCSGTWVAPAFYTTAPIALAVPIISAIWLAITIAREPRDHSPADADPHFAAEGA